MCSKFYWIIQKMHPYKSYEISAFLWKNHWPDGHRGEHGGVRALARQLIEGCPELVGHLRAAIWNKQRTKFEFVDGFGHFDGVDALKYLCRHVVRGHNPWPSTAYDTGEEDHLLTPRADRAELAELEELRSLFE